MIDDNKQIMEQWIRCCSVYKQRFEPSITYFSLSSSRNNDLFDVMSEIENRLLNSGTNVFLLTNFWAMALVISWKRRLDKKWFLNCLSVPRVRCNNLLRIDFETVSGVNEKHFQFNSSELPSVQVLHLCLQATWKI